MPVPLKCYAIEESICTFGVHGGLKFYETAHVKDFAAHLKLFVNLKDELAWNRVLLLVSGVGSRPLIPAGLLLLKSCLYLYLEVLLTALQSGLFTRLRLVKDRYEVNV